MQIAGIIIGCVLFGQVPDAVLPPLSEPARGAPADLQAVAPSETSATVDAVKRRRPPELVDEAVHLPEGSAITGRPLTLLEALGSTFDRRRQYEIVQAYWRLTEATAEYHYALEYSRSLESAAGAQDAALLSSRAAAASLCRESELRATEAQYELAALAMMQEDAPLPLPADQPHVGAYRTYFNELFAGRTPPDAARLTDKLLPLQRRAIDQSASAVLAAEDAFSAVSEDLRSGRGTPDSLVSSAQMLFFRRQSFIRLVCEYNRSIAEYGLSVASPSTSPRQLVAMLIGPPRQASLPRSADARNSAGSGVNQPTLAPPREKNEPTPAPPRDRWRPNEPTPAPPRNEPTLAPPRETIERLGYDEPAKPSPPEEPNPESADPSGAELVPVGPPVEFSPAERTVRKPLDAAAATPMYPALRDAAPASRAKQLAAAIFWTRSLPEDAGKPITLKECLFRNYGGDRLETVAAYWRLRRQAAWHQVLTEQSEALDALMPVVLQRRNDPTGPADMLRLNAAQQAVQADLNAARAELVEAQFDLARLIGATAEPAWPLASTLPHTGEYQLKLDLQPRSLTGTWPIRRLAAVIPARCDGVWKSAEAVVEADAARAATAEKYRLGTASIGQVLETVAAQTEQSAAFLNAIAEYNRAIAEYATSVLPSASPVEKLAAALVVEP